MFAMSPWFAAQWERTREKRAIAELEELARMLVVLWGTGTSGRAPRRGGLTTTLP